jgi:hypothetical protein
MFAKIVCLLAVLPIKQKQNFHCKLLSFLENFSQKFLEKVCFETKSLKKVLLRNPNFNPQKYLKKIVA